MVVEMKKTQREAELVAARRAIEKVALKEHKAVEEVRTAMIEAMTEGFNSKDPSARAMWTQIPCEGEMPTPEELIAWVGKRLNGGQFALVNKNWTRGHEKLDTKVECLKTPSLTEP